MVHLSQNGAVCPISPYKEAEDFQEFYTIEEFAVLATLEMDGITLAVCYVLLETLKTFFCIPVIISMAFQTFQTYFFIHAVSYNLNS